MQNRMVVCLRGSAILVVACSLLMAPVGSRAQATEPTITDITVVGNKNLNRESIIATAGLKIGDKLTQAMLDEAKRRLLQTQLYGANRTEDPDDAVRVSATVQPDGARVRIEVEENDLVKGVNITGSGPIPALVIRDLMQIKEGFVLNMATLRRDVEAIQEHYKAKGYLATVSGDLAMPNGILEVPIIVAKVDEVKITGLHKTKPSVVTREMRLKKGQYYHAATFEKDYYRIFNTDLFADVSPAIVPKAPGLVDITLNIEEKRTGNVSLFIGYSSRNNLVGGAEIVESNFMGRGQAISFRWDTGGYANRNSLELGFAEPWLDPKHTSLSASVYDKTVYRFARGLSSTGAVVDSNNDYYEVHTGAQVTLSRPFGEAYRGSVGLRYDNVNLPSMNLDPEDAAALQKGPLMATSLRMTHNTRDVDLDPASGGYEIYTVDIGRADLRPLSGSQASSAVSGIVNFQKVQVDARRYLSLQGPRKKPKDRRTTVAIRLAAGTTSGTSPFFEQYFVGGAETLRGYNEDRFWGTRMLLASVELRAPLAPSLTGVVFADAGDAWGGPYGGVKFADFEQHNGFSPSVGLGLGLRVVTPIGQIRIDQGFGREGARTHFSIGHVF